MAHPKRGGRKKGCTPNIPENPVGRNTKPCPFCGEVPATLPKHIRDECPEA